MKAFRAKDGHFVARLDETEREVVSQLALDVAELLGATPVQLAGALEVPGGSHRGAGSAYPAHPDPAHPDPAHPGRADVAEESHGTDDPSRDDAAAAHASDDAPVSDPWDLPGLADPFAGLASGAGGRHAADPEEPDDPAVRRLLPAASDDADVADEFRRLVQPDLRQLKIERLLALVRALRRGEKLIVPADRADLLSGALVDIRLVLAERLGIDSDEAADELYRDLTLVSHGADGEPVVGGRRGPAAALRLHLGSAYAALTWLQESLVTVQLEALESRDA